VIALTSPFGPEPITTASTLRGSMLRD